MGKHLVRSIAACVVLVAVSACSTLTDGQSSESSTFQSEVATETSPPTTAAEQNDSVPSASDATAGPPLTRPDWLGQRPLPTNSSGFGVAQPTPDVLVDRQLPTIDTLPPPADQVFAWTIETLEGEPLRRSTWEEGCPVPPEELSYVTVSFRGFDGLNHTGELIVAAKWALDIVSVFEQAWMADYPFEEMRIVTPADLVAAPTGDGNNTASFVCRAVTGGSRFSEHAYGLAIDINPFHNPYIRDDLVLPELAGAYLERDDLRLGLLTAESVVVQAFKDIGWFWGGEWSSLKDWQHFSHNGQ